MTGPLARLSRSMGEVGPTAFLVAAGAVTVLNLIPYGETLLYPLAVFTTWVHETSHALVAMVLGAHVEGLLVRPDTSGLATYLYNVAEFGTASRAATASAGYLGAALVAAGLLATTRRPLLHRAVLAGLALVMILTVTLWVRTAFGIIVLLLIAAGLGALAVRGSATIARWALLLLGLQTALNALFDIRALYYVHGMSDAQTMSQLIGLPAAFWATLWLLVGGVVLVRTFLASVRGRRDSTVPKPKQQAVGRRP
jgi:hypothetical protein